MIIPNIWKHVPNHQPDDDDDDDDDGDDDDDDDASWMPCAKQLDCETATSRRG